MYNLVEAIRISTVYITPFMPNTPAKVWAQLGPVNSRKFKPGKVYWSGAVPTGIKINKGNLFSHASRVKEAGSESPAAGKVKEKKWRKQERTPTG